MKRLLLVVFLVMALAVIPLVGCETADDEVVDREPRPEVVEPEPVAPEEPEVVEPVPEAEPEPAVPEEPEVVAPAPEPEAEEPEPVLIEFAGSGDYLTPIFDLRDGIVILEMTHDGDRNFIVKTIGEENGWELSANHIGEYSGTRAHQVHSESFLRLEPGPHRLEVQADGDWEVKLTQSVFEDAEDLPLEYSGSGDMVLGPAYIPTGTRPVYLTHEGDSNFIVWLLSIDGYDRDLLANTIGDYEGTVAVQAREGRITYLEPGPYVVSVRADGSWTIRIGD